MRTTDEIVAEVCSALSVEHVEIRPARTVECATCCEPFLDGRCPNACADVGEERAMQQQIVRTASFAYYGNDRLDVSPGSTDGIGAWFAPSEEIWRPVQAAFRHSWYLGAKAAIDCRYEYTAELRVRYGIVPGSEAWSTIPDADQRRIYRALSRGIEPAPSAWDALLSMSEVTLVCSCEERARCHRETLAEILVRLGAKYVGEVQ